MDNFQNLISSLHGHGSRPAFVHLQRAEMETWSFERLAESVGCMTAGLMESGLEKGDRAVLYAKKSVPWVVSCLAVINAGAIPVPLDSQMDTAGLGHVLEDSEASWIFTDKRGAERLEKLHLDGKLTCVFLDASDKEHDWRRYESTEVSEVPASGADADDVAVLFYTSGTTGKPKGVPLTHHNLLSNLTALRDLELIGADDRLMLPLPLHHVYPFTVGLLTPLAAGAAIVFPLSLTGRQILRALRDSQVTGIIAVPRFYEALWGAIDARAQQAGGLFHGLFKGALALSVGLRRGLSWNLGRWCFSPVRRKFAPSLRVVASGGSALDPALAWKLEGLGWAVATGYGLTETSPILTFNPPGEGRIETAGRALEDVEIRVADPEEKQEFGEIQVRGPNVFSGYLHLDEKTRKSFTPDGYFRTGDLGYMQDGYLHLRGRASTMIVLSGGENIQPQEIEEAVEQRRGIREAAVFERDDRLAALIVPEPAARQGEDEEVDQRIRRELKDLVGDLPSHHRISDYALTGHALPRTRLGKVRRHELPRLFDEAKENEQVSRPAAGPMPIAEMSPEDRELLEDPAVNTLWDWLSDRFSDAALTPDTNLQLELGVESFDWVDLTLRIQERTGLEVAGEAIGRIETVRDLLREAHETADSAGAQELLDRLERPTELLDEEQQRWLQPPARPLKLLGVWLFAFNRVLMKRLLRLEVRGLEHLPREKHFVLVPNHVSYLDAPAVAAALPEEQLRKTFWSGWTDILFSNPVMRLMSRATRVLPIEGGGGPFSSLAFGAAVLRVGENLVWFAEGGMSRSGTLQQFRPGVGLLLAAQRITALPVCIEGTREALPADHWWPLLHPVRVTFGPPRDYAQLLTEGTGEDPYERVANALHDHLARLCDNRTGVPPG